MEGQDRPKDEGYGIDAVIAKVVRKADISEKAAAHAVDIVLTAVKHKLPPPMAAKLVRVVAGEDCYDTVLERSRKTIARVPQRLRSGWQTARQCAVASAVESWQSFWRLLKFW
jgi:hypothetical protein